MWLPTPSKFLGSVDVADLAERIAVLAESEWSDGEYLRQQLTLARQTHSIFLKSISTPEFTEILSGRPLKQEDVQDFDIAPVLTADILKLVEAALAHYPSGGVITRIQLARMRAGARINPHIDNSAMLKIAHRLHVPITTNAGVKFSIGGAIMHMPAGEMHELNNRVTHSVENTGQEHRIHLIVDYLSPNHNQPEALERRFELLMKQRLKQAASPPAPRSTKVRLPKVIATSVVRGAQKRESHGGVYLVDLETEEIQQVVDWNTVDISWEGRGWDRGLRGISFYQGNTLIAASDEVYCFDRSFNIIKSWTCPYLRHAHEIHLYQDHLLISSTGFDSILGLNLKTDTFDKGWLIRRTPGNRIGVASFDPREQGPPAGNQLHINSVYRDASGLYVGARALPFLLLVSDEGSRPYARIPTGSHNAVPFAGGTLFNDTNADVITYETPDQFCHLEVPTYPSDALLNKDLGDEKLARQGFGRGLCHFKDDIVIAGSSPSTVTAWDLKAGERLRSVNLSMDIRNAIHGLALWPY